VAAAPAETTPSVSGAAWVQYTDFPPGGSVTELTVLSARVLPSGEPTGTMVLRSPLGDVRAEVTCLVVVDGDVVVGGTIVQGFDYFGLRVKHIANRIRDLGSTGDLVAGAIYVDRPRPPEFDPCTPLLPFQPVYAAEPGNYVVGG
jgi:hypothetical protein